MALDVQALVDNACTRLEGKGFKVDGEFSRQREFIEAVAEAFVEEIQTKAKVIIDAGSSAGEYDIE